MSGIDGMNDEQLVAEAQTGLRGQGASVEMMRRLKTMIERELQAAHELSRKIHRLNQALLWYTIALAVMAAFQFGAWIRDVSR